MKKYLLLVLSLMFVVNVAGQQDCSVALDEAGDLFDQGLIETIPDKLGSCLEKGFSRDEKMQAYKLVILSHLYADNIVEADLMMLEFLNDFPSYKPLSTDPREFVSLMETYDTYPVLRLGGCIGTNISQPVITERLGVQNYETSRGRYYPGGAGFQGAISAKKDIAEHLEFNAQIQFEINRFNYELYANNEVDFYSGEINDFCSVFYSEFQSYISVPLSLNYSFQVKGFKPYVLIGVKPVFMLSSTGNSLLEYVDDGESPNLNEGDIPYNDNEVPATSVLGMRRLFNLWAQAGAGMSYDAGFAEFFLEARFQLNAMTQLRPGSAPFIEEFAWQSFFVCDDFKLNSLAISAGAHFPIYNPKKKEK